MARRSKQPKNARRSKGERSAATVQRQRQRFEGRPVADEDPYAAIEDDLRLPDRYSAKSDLDKGLVTIVDGFTGNRSEEHTSELQSLMRISYAVFCLKKKKK